MRKNGGQANASQTIYPGKVHWLVAPGGSRVGPGASGSAKLPQLGISEQSYYRWCSEHGGLKLQQALRMKDLEKENGRLKKAVAERTLDKQLLKKAPERSFKP